MIKHRIIKLVSLFIVSNIMFGYRAEKQILFIKHICAGYLRAGRLTANISYNIRYNMIQLNNNII